MSTWEDSGWSIRRSYLDPKVWVPVNEDSDIECFLHAAGLNAVKRWVRGQVGEEGDWAKFRTESDDLIVVAVREEGTIR